MNAIATNIFDLRSKFFIALSLCFITCGSDKVDPGSEPIVAKIDVSAQQKPISKYLYGMFLEHLGNADVGDLIDDGISAEILDDRKFFYPVDVNDVQIPANKKDSANQWVPVNHAESVVMDSVNAYVGVHSPKVHSRNGISEGISQSGLTVAENKKYVGRIVLAGSPGVSVTISLVWGKNPSERATFNIDKLSSNYRKYPFTLDCKGNTKNAKIEIAGSGEGTFSIGAVSLMPEDNMSGFRSDVIRLLKGLNSGLYRWGGNMSSGYDWRDGIGDPDQRPPRYEYAWNALESNDVGTHELIKFAELINVELCLTVNTGLGDAYSAAQWVEYVNGSKDTPMGKLRTENGHAEPFGIKLWCVGNEAYGWWQLGHTDLKSYIIKHNMFAEKMLKADPTIKLVGSGASIEEMTITGSAKRETGKVLAEYDSASDWTGGLLRHADHVDYVSEHFYCAVDQRFDSKEGKYVNVDEPLVDWTRRPANRVRAKAEHYNEYHKRIPRSKRIPVYIDEWAYFTNWVHPAPTLGVTIGYARGLHEMFRHADLIKMAGFTFGTSCLSFNDTEVIYNASGLLFKLYQSQFGSIPVQVVGNRPQPSPKYPVGGDQPMINAGGDTYPLDMVAALTSDKKTLTIALVNPTETEQKITIQLNGAKVSNKITRCTISGTSTMARNLIGKDPQVTVKENALDITEGVTVQPASINIYRYELL
jgi:alpha-N-arabinofuranosidase